MSRPAKRSPERAAVGARRWAVAVWWLATYALTFPAAAASSPSGDGPDVIFADSFESGNTLAWSARQPPLPVPDAFRASDLDLRDPHVFVDFPGFGCVDFTDTALPLGTSPSFNDQLATAIAGDGDGDGLLDLSLIFGFRPFLLGAAGERLDQGMGACSDPLVSTECDWQIPPVPFTTAYDGLAAGLCVGTVPGTTSGYLPAPAAPVVPCVVSEPRELPFELLGATVELADARLSAEIGDGLDLGGSVALGVGVVLDNGLLLGFLSESAAAAVTLPPDLPLVGGQPISVLLPGGAGNCAAGDDRDMHLGESGWWFYFDVRADPVSFIGP